MQNNAGILRLVLPDAVKARGFMTSYSKKIWENFPGLPLYGSTVPMTWTLESYKEARRKAEEQISRQRAMQPVFQGMPMLPVTRASRLDGLPAVKNDKDSTGHDEFISLPSAARRQNDMLKMARDRLRSYTPKLPGALDGEDLIRWTDDLPDMLGAKAGSENSRVAIICMDGNDLGIMFQKRLEENARKDNLTEGIQAMLELSRLVEYATAYAFTEAIAGIVAHLYYHDKGRRITMPMRPLIMGGDDIAIIIRADLALAFIQLYVDAFESITTEKGNRLTLGIGMVVMPASWPFTRAFALAEELQDSAKNATRGMDAKDRPSSLDYIVLTEEVETDVSALRNRVLTAPDAALTGKPLLMRGDAMASFLDNCRGSKASNAKCGHIGNIYAFTVYFLS